MKKILVSISLALVIAALVVITVFAALTYEVYTTIATIYSGDTPVFRVTLDTRYGYNDISWGKCVSVWGTKTQLESWWWAATATAPYCDPYGAPGTNGVIMSGSSYDIKYQGEIVGWLACSQSWDNKMGVPQRDSTCLYIPRNQSQPLTLKIETQ